MIISIAKFVCLGLEFAHSKGIIHRDPKPGNVWLSADGKAKIGDFGLAIAVDLSRVTRSAMMVGTFSYMPPEQAMGGKVTTKANLYSLGAMLYEMVTGRPPFVGDDSLSIMGQRLNTPPISPTWHRADLSPVFSPPLKSVFHKHECYSIILQIYYNWSVMESKVTLKIPRELYQKLGKMIEGTGFSSVTEFIVFVMRTLASSGEIKGEDRLTTEEVTAIRERLCRLGYLKEAE